jgi:hypothetical protein
MKKLSDDMFEDVPYTDDLFEDVPYSEDSPGLLKSAGLGALEQGTLGFGDEIGGAFQEPIGAVKKAASYLTNAQPDSDVQAYEEAKIKTQEQMDKAFQENPASYSAGAIASMLVPGAQLKGLSTAGKIASGAVAGAASGVGQSDENLIENAATGAVSGAALTGSLLGAGNLVSKGAESVKNLAKESADKITDNYRRTSSAKLIDKFNEGFAGEKIYGEDVAKDLTNQLDSTSTSLMGNFKKAFKDTGEQIDQIVTKYSNVPTKYDLKTLQSDISKVKSEAIDNSAKDQIQNIGKQLSNIINGKVGSLEKARKFLAEEIKTLSPDVSKAIKSIKNKLDVNVDTTIKSINSEDFASLSASKAKYRAIANAESDIFGKRGIRSGDDDSILNARKRSLNFLEETFTPSVQQQAKINRVVQQLGTVPEAQDILKTIKKSELISKKLPTAFGESSGNIGRADPKNILSGELEKSSYLVGRVVKKFSNLGPEAWTQKISELPEGKLKSTLTPLANSPQVFKSAALFSISQNPEMRKELQNFFGEENE